jgi:hypothetical protein
MASITASVGKGGVNRQNDVITVQKLINQNIGLITPLRPIAEDGKVVPMMINAIEEFQRRVLKISHPDGRVDPNGKTLKKLNEQSAITSPTNPGGNFQVTYSSKLPVSQQIVSDYTKNVIKLALQKSGLTQAVITSAIRTPEEQAGIMYKNAKENLAGQFSLYGSTGDEVLKVFKNNKDKEQSVVIGLMKEKIESLLKEGKRTSLHCVTVAEYNKLNIVDIGVNSTRAVCGASFNIEKFTKAFSELKDEGYIERFIDETNKTNSCWHIEVKPNKKPIT